MLEQMLQQFLGSSQGQAAMQTLQQQHGMNPATAQQALGVASEGAAQALQQAGAGQPNGVQGLFGGGLTANAITGALSGMLGGGGLGGALEGGLSGVIAGKVGEMLASRMGMNPQMAALIAAGIAPHLLNYIQARMAGQQASGPGPAAPGGGLFPGLGAQGPGVTMQPMGGPQYTPSQGKQAFPAEKYDPSSQGGKFDAAPDKFAKGDGGGKFAKGDGGEKEFAKGDGGEKEFDPGQGGYSKGAFDPSQDGDKGATPSWKKG